LLNNMHDVALAYENGLRDYPYQKFRISYIFHIPTSKIFKKMDI